MNDKLKKILFLFLIMGQLGVLLFMIIKREVLLSDGRPVLLKCEPIDPRSILSGHYVILNLDIGYFDIKEMKNLNIHNENFLENDIVYVGLIKPEDEKNKFHTAAAVSKDVQAIKSKWPLYIRGRAKYDFFADQKYGGLRVKYGSEEYFVPQHEGKKIETQMRKISAEMVIAEDGESAVKRLFIEDKEVLFY